MQKLICAKMLNAQINAVTLSLFHFDFPFILVIIFLAYGIMSMQVKPGNSPIIPPDKKKRKSGFPQTK